MTPTDPLTEIVVLSPGHDLVAEFGAAFAALPGGYVLKTPDEVSDPARIRYAFAHAPGPDDFAPFPALELVSSWGAGVDKLIRHPGLPVTVTLNRMVDPGQAQMMAAFAAHFVTGWHRGLFRYPGQQARQHWEIVNWTPNADVPVGLLGAGRMGLAVGRGLLSLGYPVRGWAARARVEAGIEVGAGEADFDRILSESVVIVNTLPLTAETDSLFDADVFARMRPDALFIHLGRGGHVVEEDLIAALDAGRPGGAALDVFATEPLPPGHPLWTHPKVMVTPHAASTPSAHGVASAIVHAIEAHAAGERPHGYVDRDRGY